MPFAVVMLDVTNLYVIGHIISALVHYCVSADAEARAGGRAHGGDGTDAGGVCGRLHRQSHRRLCYAAVWNRKYTPFYRDQSNNATSQWEILFSPTTSRSEQRARSTNHSCSYSLGLAI